MARILLIGGHGKVALLSQPLLVAAGHQVTAVIRNPDQAVDVRATGAEPHVTDVQSLSDAGFVELVGGYDVVIWSAGAGGGSPERTSAIDRDAAIRSMDAASRAGVARYVMVSWFGSVPDHGVAPDNSFFAYADAKLAADDHLRSTGLDWTILGPSTLTDDAGTGLIEVAPASGARSVPRADVAAVVAACVDQPATIGRFIRFNAGVTSIADALATLS